MSFLPLSFFLLCVGGILLLKYNNEIIDNNEQVATNCTIVDRIIIKESNNHYVGYIEALYSIDNDNYTTYFEVTNEKTFTAAEFYFQRRYLEGNVIKCYYDINDHSARRYLSDPNLFFKSMWFFVILGTFIFISWFFIEIYNH